jgi:hypothetical protein
MCKNQLLTNQESIQATLVWFGLRGRSLSAKEIFHLLYKGELSQQEIEKELLVMKKVKKHSDNTYSLCLDPTKELSQAGYREKWAVANRGAKFLRLIPFIKMVAVVNSLADKTAHKDSDIDFFIITQANRLFIVRFLTTILFSILNLRRSGKKIKDHICLSFFISDKSLNLESIAIEGEDVYLAYWIAQAIPLINYNNTFDRFITSNHWVKNIIPSFKGYEIKVTRKLLFTKLIELLSNNFIGNLLENLLATFQLKKIYSNPPSKDPAVKLITNRDMLKFHMIDRRFQYRKRWQEELASLDKMYWHTL